MTDGYFLLILTMHNNEVIITKYSDRKVVYLLSTVDEAAMAPTGRNVPRTCEPTINPSVVNSYNNG